MSRTKRTPLKTAAARRNLVVVLVALATMLGCQGLMASKSSQQQDTARSLTVTPSNLNFGPVQVGNNLTLPGVLTNSGASNVTISQATVTGTGFSLNGLTTPLILAPSQRLTFNVVFSRLSAGNDGGSISVTSNASNPTLDQNTICAQRRCGC